MVGPDQAHVAQNGVCHVLVAEAELPHPSLTGDRNRSGQFGFAEQLATLRGAFLRVRP